MTPTKSTPQLTVSHYYCLFCKTCNDESEDANHSSDKIKDFIRNWEKIKHPLSFCIQHDLIDISSVRDKLALQGLPRNIYDFMMIHENHELFVRSEYHLSGHTPDEAINENTN